MNNFKIVANNSTNFYSFMVNYWLGVCCPIKGKSWKIIAQLWASYCWSSEQNEYLQPSLGICLRVSSPTSIFLGNRKLT